MATCYDCIHCEACSDAGDAGYSSLKEDVTKCKHFKNKADVVEVKHGEWIYNTDDFSPKMRCSVCGYNKPLVAGIDIKQEPNNYCNKCGAIMDGGESHA